MIEQLIGWASAAVIAWVFAEAILHDRGTCVAMVVRRLGNLGSGDGVGRHDWGGLARNAGRIRENVAKESMR